MNEILIALLLFTYSLSVSARHNIASQSNVTARATVLTVSNANGEHEERKYTLLRKRQTAISI